MACIRKVNFPYITCASEMRLICQRRLLRSSKARARLALNSVNPSLLPSRLGSQLADSAPYEMPKKPAPKVDVWTMSTAQFGMSHFSTVCISHNPIVRLPGAVDPVVMGLLISQKSHNQQLQLACMVALIGLGTMQICKRPICG